MDTFNSPIHKQLREINHTSLADNTPKMRKERESLYLPNTNSPLRLIQVMDKRFEKLSDQLQKYTNNVP